MLSDLSITIVFDNYLWSETYGTGWGFAAVVETGEHTFLFDTGEDGATLLRNMKRASISSGSIEAIAVSHDHHDHTGGLRSLLDEREGARLKLYAPSDFSATYDDELIDKADVVRVGPWSELESGIFSTGTMQGKSGPSEHALAIQTTAGIVVLTGCAHPGIVETLLRVETTLGESPVLALGGFHLFKSDKDEIERVTGNLCRLGISHLMPSHCTGDEGIAAIKSACGEAYVPGGAGRRISVRGDEISFD